MGRRGAPPGPSKRWGCRSRWVIVDAYGDGARVLRKQRGQAAARIAHSLDGTASGLSAARRSAYAYSFRHTAYDQPITIDTSADVIFGRWHLRADECLFGGGRAFNTDGVRIRLVQ